MPRFDESEQAQTQVPTDSRLGIEALAGAVSFGTLKIFEEKLRAEGKQVFRRRSTELLLSPAGAEVEKLDETKGIVSIDYEKANRHAKENAEHMYNEHYIRGQSADRYDPWVIHARLLLLIWLLLRLLFGNRYRTPQQFNRYQIGC